MSVFESPAVHDEFCSFAAEMRSAFDAHFADPYAMKPPQHFIWNYWHVPGRYTYLRSELHAVLGRDLAARFMRHLETLSLLRYGLKPRTPWLSLYVDGCEQGLHNDAANGRLAYVFSLTRWQERRFSGGETLLLRPEARSVAQQIKSSSLGDLMQSVPADFNRLILFDDRQPHGVARLSGTMAPAEGRLVIHGHLVETEPMLIGVLPAEALAEIGPALEKYFAHLSAKAEQDLHGVVTLRADVSPAGSIGNARVLSDIAWALTAKGETSKRDIVQEALARLGALKKFPAAAGPSMLIASIRFGAGF